jgi:hypothetical protein
LNLGVDVGEGAVELRKLVSKPRAKPWSRFVDLLEEPRFLVGQTHVSRSSDGFGTIVAP